MMRRRCDFWVQYELHAEIIVEAAIANQNKNSQDIHQKRTSNKKEKAEIWLRQSIITPQFKKYKMIKWMKF